MAGPALIRRSDQEAWKRAYDQAAAKLDEMAGAPDSLLPYGMAILEPRSFAMECYQTRSRKELSTVTIKPEDMKDMATWRLTSEEWARQLGAAYAAREWDAQHGLG